MTKMMCYIHIVSLVHLDSVLDLRDAELSLAVSPIPLVVLAVVLAYLSYKMS